MQSRITWESLESGGRRGRDDHGNRFYENACQEIVTVVTPDGKEGMGWTPDQALESAIPRK